MSARRRSNALASTASGGRLLVRNQPNQLYDPRLENSNLSYYMNSADLMMIARVAAWGRGALSGPADRPAGSNERDAPAAAKTQDKGVGALGDYTSQLVQEAFSFSRTQSCQPSRPLLTSDGPAVRASPVPATHPARLACLWRLSINAPPGRMRIADHRDKGSS